MLFTNADVEQTNSGLTEGETRDVPTGISDHQDTLIQVLRVEPVVHAKHTMLKARQYELFLKVVGRTIVESDISFGRCYGNL